LGQETWVLLEDCRFRSSRSSLFANLVFKGCVCSGSGSHLVFGLSGLSKLSTWLLSSIRRMNQKRKRRRLSPFSSSGLAADLTVHGHLKSMINTIARRVLHVR
jgi:hypothetical protein